MRKIIILILWIIISINISNAENNICEESNNISWWSINIEWEWHDCSWKYYLEQEKYSACFKIKTIKEWKVLKEVCDKSFFNDKYSEEEQKIYKPYRIDLIKNSYYKSIYIDLHQVWSYLKYDNHIIYKINANGYDNSQKEIIWKKEDFLWYYIDDKRIFKYGEYSDDMSNQKDIKFNPFSNIANYTNFWYTVKVNWKNKSFKAYYLSEKQRNTIDNFINNKIPFSNYNKVYSNIEKIRKKYTDMSIKKHRFLKEVLDYIYSEMKINELKNWEIGIIKYKWDIPVQKWYIKPVELKPLFSE
jgi:hypothetical protein